LNSAELVESNGGSTLSVSSIGRFSHFHRFWIDKNNYQADLEGENILFRELLYSPSHNTQNHFSQFLIGIDSHIPYQFGHQQEIQC